MNPEKFVSIKGQGIKLLDRETTDTSYKWQSSLACQKYLYNEWNNDIAISLREWKHKQEVLSLKLCSHPRCFLCKAALWPRQGLLQPPEQRMGWGKARPLWSSRSHNNLLMLSSTKFLMWTDRLWDYVWMVVQEQSDTRKTTSMITDLFIYKQLPILRNWQTFLSPFYT
jgi:hypothetical protein